MTAVIFTKNWIGVDDEGPHRPACIANAKIERYDDERSVRQR